jgi:hypothetical protein
MEVFGPYRKIDESMNKINRYIYIYIYLADKLLFYINCHLVYIYNVAIF